MLTKETFFDRINSFDPMIELAFDESMPEDVRAGNMLALADAMEKLMIRLKEEALDLDLVVKKRNAKVKDGIKGDQGD